MIFHFCQHSDVNVWKDPGQATSVLEIQCVNVENYLTQTGSLYVSPMLLLFICILVNSQEIDPNVNK